MSKLDPLTKTKISDVTIELFNYCEGSCPGCMLSTEERKKDHLPIENLEGVIRALKQLAEYGPTQGVKFRPVFVFGDVPKADPKKLFKLFDTCQELELPFGMTATGTAQPFKEKYQALITQFNAYPLNTVIDVTIDPFRLIHPDWSKEYQENLEILMAKSKELHVQVLGSQALFKQFSPQTLAQTLKKAIGKTPVFIAFTPTQENLKTKPFQYQVGQAYEYVSAFYQQSEELKQFWAAEENRFTLYAILGFIKS